MKLYSYQEQAIAAIQGDPSTSQLISMPTGTGKTVTFLAAIQRLNKRALVLVHRNELLDQTYEKAIAIGFEESEISVIRSSNKQEINRLTIAMVPTLIRNLDLYDPAFIEMVVVDEAHHALAESYIRVLRHFRVAEESKLLLGFTATPMRGDGKELSKIFQSHSFKITLSEATINGYICPVNGLRIEMHRSLADIDQVQGDYDLAQLDKVMNCPEVNEVIASKCSLIRKNPGIVFCTSVDHSKKIAKLMREKGIKAISVSYLTSPWLLAKVFDLLKEGRIDYLTNTVKLSEGFDYPPIEVIVLARPTRSPVLYKQMIGRGLRKSPGKTSCLVVECSGTDEKMIKWEDIDENSTFQSVPAAEKKSREEALAFYRGRLNSTSIIVQDVRLSPFRFYECKLHRVVPYKKFFWYVPGESGFFVAKAIRAPRHDPRSTEIRYNMYICVCLYEEKKHIRVWQADWFYHTPEGHPLNDFPRICRDVTRRGGWGGEDMIFEGGRWYPSEEDEMTFEQQKLLGIKKGHSARKAEMIIEDRFITQFISTYLESVDNKTLVREGSVISVHVRPAEESSNIKNIPAFLRKKKPKKSSQSTMGDLRELDRRAKNDG